MPVTSTPNNLFSSTNISEEIGEFFKEHNIDSTNALIPELSRYITLTHNSTNKERNDNIIKAYDQTIGRMTKENFLGEHTEEFLSLINELVEGHRHQERFTAVNKKYTPIKETPEKIIIDNLKELLEDITVVSGFKQSDHYKEFEEKINDIITTYNNSKLNPDIVQQHKASPLPIIKAKLIELDKWCEETAKKDNSQVFKNIGKVIKHSLKAVASLITGDTKAFKTEIDNIRLHIDGIKNANKNTIDAIKKVQNFVKEYASSKEQSPTKQPSKNKSTLGR